jgi:polyisoprenoid-binding protein YceI
MTRQHLVAAALFALVSTAATASAQDARLVVGADSKLWIEGTSNLHGWSCKAEKLDAAIDVDAAAAMQLGSAPAKSLKKVQVKVPVRSLKCGHGGMDDNMYKALKATDGTPEISYILATFDAVQGDMKDTFTLHTVGTLTVAGKENSVNMDVVATRLPDGSVKAKGTLPIKMTDYDIKPPTAIFGTLKTGNEVKINFELTIGAKAIAAAAGQP